MMKRPRPKRDIPEGYPLELDPNIDEKLVLNRLFWMRMIADAGTILAMSTQ
jgi:hypothetical protein